MRMENLDAVVELWTTKICSYLPQDASTRYHLHSSSSDPVQPQELSIEVIFVKKVKGSFRDSAVSRSDKEEEKGEK
ncbi:hypothetical protein PIB30_074855 [Stylosanthes scabra]|uniref:Uncharacterized protein n=1 Tax=Stylosanthes scabra TaxID=79078 RepID=A0ABU6VPT2_9FABA|nr:hypothetical protein [Stylosanthes scabra]